MEEQLLPIVTFGRYKDKSVLELLADEKYVEWLKQQAWFSNQQKQIYNIVVHQTISTTNNSKTPEHNKLQNLFLDKSNQQKLLSKLCKKNASIDRTNNLLKEENIIRLFGENIIPEFVNKLDNTIVKFEDKFNWDLVLYYRDNQRFTITSNLETEIFDKIKYKEQYDIEENEKYNNLLLSIDILIEGTIKLQQECIKKYSDEYEKYENNLKVYLQQKPQNEKDIEKYEKKLKVYQTTRDEFITNRKKLICQELGINYDNFVNWNITNNGYSHLDRDTKHTIQEKRQLHEIVYDKLKPFIKEFEGMYTTPNLVEKLNIPTKPPSPEKFYLREEDGEIYNWFVNVRKFNYHYGGASYDSVNLNKYKKDFENQYKKDYENNFNKHYEKYRLQYYIDIINKYIDRGCCVKKINENQYEISTYICQHSYAVCCELKPTLSDDYPTVLRKLKTQIELTKYDRNFESFDNKYILIIGSFTSIDVSKKQLISIFNQSNIKVIFTDEIFETSNTVAIECVRTNTTTKQAVLENKLVEENKFLTDNLLQTQQKLLQAEDKIKQLEEEMLSLKSRKQSKSIKDYFGKK